MKVIGVELRDVYITLDFSLQEVQHILNFLDKANLSYNKEEDPKTAKAVEFVNEDLFPILSKLEKDVENGFGPNST